MKIVYVVPVLAPYAIPRFQELAKIDSVEVHVIVEKATSSDRIGWKFEEIEGVTAHLIEKNYSHKYIKKNKSGKYSQNEEHIFSFGLKKIINKIKPDIVLLCNSCQLLMLLGPRKYKLGMIVEDTLRADEGRKNFNRIIKKMLLKKADFYCAFSNDSVLFLNEYGIEGPIIRTSWSIDNLEFTSMSKDEITEYKHKHSICENKKNFFLVSNLIKRKGIIEFLFSWMKLPVEILNKIELLIAGDGPLKEELEIFKKNNNLVNVKLLGHIDYNSIKKYLQSVDIFALPTLEDLNSLSVYEAIAAKRPLLISKYNGSRFLVNDGKNGYVFDPLDQDDTIYKIEKILNSDLNNMSLESKNISELYTNKEVMKKLYVDLCQIL